MFARFSCFFPPPSTLVVSSYRARRFLYVRRLGTHFYARYSTRKSVWRAGERARSREKRSEYKRKWENEMKLHNFILQKIAYVLRRSGSPPLPLSRTPSFCFVAWLLCVQNKIIVIPRESRGAGHEESCVSLPHTNGPSNITYKTWLKL